MDATHIAQNGDAPHWLEPWTVDPEAATLLLIESRLRGPAGDASGILENLLAWMDALGSEVAGAIDVAASTWAKENWGKRHPESRRDVAHVVRAWSTVGDLAVQLDEANELRATLRAAVLSDERYLMNLSAGPAQDPRGRVVGGIVPHQPDRTLASLWWRILMLPEGMPLHHVRYGVAGVLGLPRIETEQGRFPAEAVEALMQAGYSLRRVAHEGRVSAERAERLLNRVTGRSLAAFPKRSWWVDHLRTRHLEEPLRTWFVVAFPALEEAHQPVQGVPQSKAGPARRGSPVIADRDGWTTRSQTIRGALAKRGAAALPDARNLIDEQRVYAERTGDTYFLVRSLCSFAKVIRPSEPALAQEWALEATVWDPTDGYTWSTHLRTVWDAEGPAAALPFAFASSRRLPEDKALVHEVGEALRELNCLVQAEEVFRSELEQFPADAITLAALGDVLLRRGLFAEALRYFQAAVQFDPNSSVVIRGISCALRELDRPGEAIAAVEPHLDSPQGGIYLWAEYIKALADAGRTADEQAALAAARRRGMAPYAPQAFPLEDTVLWVPISDRGSLYDQARLLRYAALRAEVARDTYLNAAREALDHAADADQDDALYAQRALLLGECGQVEEADEGLAQVLVVRPASISVHHAHAELGLMRARRDSAFEPEYLRSLQGRYRRLADVNLALRPVAELGAARTALALTDGVPSEKAARKAVQRVREWPTGGIPRHRQWWQERVSTLLESGNGDDGGVEALRRNARENSAQLDALEEAMVARVASAH